MPSIGHYWTSNTPYQAGGTTVQWDWVMGENQHYWGYSVRPWTANFTFEVVRQWTSSDNNLVHTQHLLVAATPNGDAGGLFRMSAIVVEGS